MWCQWYAGTKHHLLLLERHWTYEAQLCPVEQQNCMQAAIKRTGDSWQGLIKKDYWDSLSKKLIAPQTLDQSEEDKVCGPDQTDKCIMRTE